MKRLKRLSDRDNACKPLVGAIENHNQGESETDEQAEAANNNVCDAEERILATYTQLYGHVLSKASSTGFEHIIFE